MIFHALKFARCSGGLENRGRTPSDGKEFDLCDCVGSDHHGEADSAVQYIFVAPFRFF